MVDLKIYMLKITLEFVCVCRYVKVNGTLEYAVKAKMGE
jgi:hypothetical protein